MREIERSAASVEEAVEAALAELGLSEQEAEVEILQEPKSGFLGLGSQPAIVKVRASGQDEATSADADADADGQADAVAAFVEGLAEAMDLEVDVEINTSGGWTYVDLWGTTDGEDMGLLIGKRGHTLDALQELVRSHILHELGERCSVLVDVEDYRKRRISQVARLAREVGRRVQKTGTAEGLDPMTALERKIVHDTVAELGGLETASEGEEPDRRVVISRSD